jgi:uncharacterized protein
MGRYRLSSDKRAMNLEQIDGFLAALVCGPDDILQSEYLPEIWGRRHGQ